jgi:hypothetical protein
MRKSRTWFRQAQENIKKIAGTKLKRKDCGKKEETADFHSSTHIKCKLCYTKKRKDQNCVFY